MNAAAPGEDQPFTIAFLPDTQIYSARYPQHFQAQTEWIAANRERENIRLVLHAGDVVHNGAEEPLEWQRAAAAMDVVYEAQLPVVTAIGNHDYDDKAKTRSSTVFNRHFGLDRYEGKRWFAGALDPDRAENLYALVEAGGKTLLVLVLEFGPRERVVAWAHDILAAFQTHPALILTHNYMYFDDTRSQPGHRWVPQNYGIGDDAHDGEQLWQQLVKHHANVFLVVGGHNLGDGLGYRVDNGVAGNRVHQILANYQMHDEGGAGFLRLFRVDPGAGQAEVRTYSPSLDAHKTDPGNHFTMRLDWA